jgi:hypothetical protein
MQPAIPFFRPLHLSIELVEEFVAQKVVFCKVELPPRIPEAVVVASARKV